MKKLFLQTISLLCICALLAPSVSALSAEEARSILRQHYVYALPEEANSAETLDELFSCVSDPYTVYFTAEQYRTFLDEVEGESSFTGIGITIAYTENGILITSLLDDRAKASGLSAGDLIVAINGESCVPADASHREKLLGAAGSVVKITVRHESGDLQSISVVRHTVTLPNTTFEVKSGVGYIDCNSFGLQTGTYFTAGVKKNDNSVHTWVVDLRGNSGGVAESAVTALGAFTGEGNKLSYKSADGYCLRNICYDKAQTSSPVIVLTDGGTASASEIFAGGIAGLHAGIVIGSRTYGKGVAQIVFDESNSPYFDGDALKVTAYRFYCADGNTTDKVGVIPTLLVNPLQAEAVAELLCGTKPTDGSEYLHLVLNELNFYVNLPDASHEALVALISSLAPDAELYLGKNGAENAVTAEQAHLLLCGENALRGFSDIAGSEYADEIGALAAYRLVLGNGGLSFRPDDTMTRAEVCALLSQALCIGMENGSFFSDVSEDRWYASSVNAMAALGLVNGVGGGKFDPSGTMTQEEFITVMGRLAEFLNLDAFYYLDATPLAILSPLEKYAGFASWSLRSLSLLTEGIAGDDGKSQNMLFAELDALDADAPITRAQAASTMYRTLTTLGVLSY